MSWLKNLRKWFNATSSDIFKAAAFKITIAAMMVNLQNGDGT